MGPMRKSLILALTCLSCSQPEAEVKPPNFLILMSDNHSWNHVGAYGDPVVKTPNIDALAENGIRFTQAYCSSPSCTPARASMLTGQDIWRLEEGANLWGTLPAKFAVFTDLLEQAGYLVGHEGKGWGPGNYEAAGRDRNPAGEKFGSFEEFYNERERRQPFFYWFSSRDPHRPYRRDGGKKAGIDTSSIEVPPYLPDHPDVRGDIADYYGEIQHFDGEVGGYLELLMEMGELENTIVIVASDNGWQMPRGLANLYDAGTRLPLVITSPKRFPGGRVVDDFVTLTDFAPTILELAGLEIPADVTAKSLVDILTSDKSGTRRPHSRLRRHRARAPLLRSAGRRRLRRSRLRTKDYLYIRNYEPDAWPAGDPPLYGDVDAHMLHYPAPTKILMLKNRGPLFEPAFGKRPAEELFDMGADPHQMTNVANAAEYQETKQQLSRQLTDYLTKTGDPRETGGEMKWIGAQYFAEKDFHPEPSEEARGTLGLEERYNWVD